MTATHMKEKDEAQIESFLDQRFSLYLCDWGNSALVTFVQKDISRRILSRDETSHFSVFLASNEEEAVLSCSSESEADGSVRFRVRPEIECTDTCA